MKAAVPTLNVLSGSGAVLELQDGRRLLDCISSWWVTLHGHAQPEIAAAIAAQAGSPLRGVVKEFPGMSVDGALDLRFSARRGRTLLCGIELIADDLEPGKIFSLERKKAGHRLIRAGKR